MTILLSLLTALSFGAGDFAGGLAAKRARLIEVMVGSHLIGLVGVTVAALVLAEGFAWSDLLLGAAGGVAGLVGLALLYRNLAAGPMAVVAPVTAVASAAVPAAWGLLTGESLTVWTGAGVGLAFVAIGLVSLSDDGGGAPVTSKVVAESLLGGVGFGTFFIFLDATASASAPWPVVGARIASVLTLLVIFAAQRRRDGPQGPIVATRHRPTQLLIATAGAFDVAANIVFLYATNRGDLTTVAVLSSLYPAITALLAWLVLHERLSRLQLVGFAAAIVATALISS